MYLIILTHVDVYMFKYEVAGGDMITVHITA